MQKTVFITLISIAFFTYCAQSMDEGNENQNTGSKPETLIENKKPEKNKTSIDVDQKKKNSKLKNLDFSDKDSAVIFFGEQKLVIVKKSDYDYHFKAYLNKTESADTTIYTGYSPIQIFYNEHFFVMEASGGSLIVYDATRNSFKKYKGATSEYSVMSLRLLDNKLYVGYFAFDVQTGAIMVLDLNSNNQLFINNVDGETIESASVKATKKDGKVYIVWNEGSKGQQVYSIEGDGLKKVNIDITDTFENTKLEELFK
jgi:hypothetical protein